MTHEFSVHQKTVEVLRKNLEKEIRAIRRERFRWAEKSMTGVVPDDIARSKQQQLAAQLLDREAKLEGLTAPTQYSNRALLDVMTLAESLALVYREAQQPARRALNQAWFEWLATDGPDRPRICETSPDSLAVAISTAVADLHRAERFDEHKRPAAGGSNVISLVVLTGASSKQLAHLIKMAESYRSG